MVLKRKNDACWPVENDIAHAEDVAVDRSKIAEQARRESELTVGQRRYGKS